MQIKPDFIKTTCNLFFYYLLAYFNAFIFYIIQCLYINFLIKISLQVSSNNVYLMDIKI